MGQAMYLDRVNTRLPEILTRSFFAPHGAQSCIALGEGDSHAMPIGYCVEQCPEWVLNVLMQMARPTDDRSNRVPAAACATQATTARTGRYPLPSPRGIARTFHRAPLRPF